MMLGVWSHQVTRDLLDIARVAQCNDSRRHTGVCVTLGRQAPWRHNVR